MDLPSDIETQIIDYLNQEYGAYEEQEMLRETDLTYVGEYVVDGRSTRFWSFPCSTEPGCWATVEEYESSYLISVTTEPPVSD